MPQESVLSWTSTDPRQSTLFSSWGVLYRFATEIDMRGQMTTTLWRAIRKNKEDRVARLEWAPNGGLGRAIIGKQQYPMADLVRPDARDYNVSRVFNGPDGRVYRWRPGPAGETMLYDQGGHVIAFFRQVRAARSPNGDVHYELHFIEDAGSGTVLHPPLMDAVLVTAMLYRLVTHY